MRIRTFVSCLVVAALMSAPAGGMTIVFPEQETGGRVAGELAALSLSGRVAFADGRPAAGVAVALTGSTEAATRTDAGGNYAFSGLLAGRTYTVTPSRADLVIQPNARTFRALAADGVALFTAVSTDVTTPVLTVPGRITADATSAAGAVVTFTVTASDDFDPAPLVACEPPSGSTFAAGTTTVRCSATDRAGNRSEASFAVEVSGAREQVGTVGQELSEATATAAPKAADKLEDANAKAATALGELAKGDRQAALGAIEGTVGDLEAAVKDGLVPRAEGDALMGRLAGAARLVAATAIGEASARGGSAQKIAEANASLAAGDARLAAGAFKDAVNKYKDALTQAEGA